MNRIISYGAVVTILVMIFSCQNEKMAPIKPSYNFYIGTYTQKESHVDGKGEGIYQIRLNTSDYSATTLKTITDIVNPSFIKLSKDKKQLYAVSEIAPNDQGSVGKISVYEVDSTYARLKNSAETNGNSPCHIAINPNNDICVVTNYFGGSLIVYPFARGFNNTTQKLATSGSSVNAERQEASHLHSTVFMHNNEFAYVADLGADQIYIYAVNQTKGLLVPAQKTPIFKIEAKGAGPRHMVISNDDAILYVVNELNSTISSYSIEKTSGSLTLINTVSTLPQGFTGQNNAADIHLGASGKYLYASNRGANDIAVFSTDASGKLTLKGNYPTEGQTPRNFAITTDGAILLAANQDSDNISVYTIGNDGGLTFQKSIALKTPVCIEEI